MSNIKREDSVLIINIRPRKTKKARKIVVANDYYLVNVNFFIKYLLCINRTSVLKICRQKIYKAGR